MSKKVWDQANWCWVPRHTVHSRQLVIGRFSYKSHYAYEVAKHFIKRRRISVVTWEGARELRRRMQDHFERRGIYVHDYQYVLSYWLCRDDRGEIEVLIEGKSVFVGRSAWHGLQSQLRKAKKLKEWDIPYVMKRLDDLCFQRRERQYRRLDALTHQYKCLLRAPHHKRRERAAYLLELFSERI